MKYLATLLLSIALLPTVFGQKRVETALTFKIGNYTTPYRQSALEPFEGYSFPTERTLPGYVAFVGVQERLRLSARWGVAAELLYGFAEYQRVNVFKPCIYCDCIGPCGDVVDTRYATYQVMLPVRTDFRFKPDGRWQISLGGGPSYTLAALQSSSKAWLGGTEPPRFSAVKRVDFDDEPHAPYRPRWQWLLHGGVSCRISERTHVGLEAFWNLRPHTIETEYGWKYAAPVPGVMKNVSVAVRNVLGRE